MCLFDTLVILFFKMIFHLKNIKLISLINIKKKYYFNKYLIKKIMHHIIKQQINIKLFHRFTNALVSA